MATKVDPETIVVADLENVEIIEDVTDGVEYDSPPLITDPSWNAYVLSKFVDEELFNGNPTVDGLRRVVEVLIGEVMETDTIMVQTPDLNNEGRATATSKVVLLCPGDKVKVFTGSADAYFGNLDGDFKKHAVAMAETRAEGRALRRALRLRNIAAEEAAGGSAEPSVNVLSPISKLQINMVDMMCNVTRGLNINVTKLIHHLFSGGKLTYDTIKGLSETDGAALIKSLGEFQRNESPVPVEILGYNSNWRTE